MLRTTKHLTQKFWPTQTKHLILDSCNRIEGPFQFLIIMKILLERKLSSINVLLIKRLKALMFIFVLYFKIQPLNEQDLVFLCICLEHFQVDLKLTGA